MLFEFRCIIIEVLFDLYRKFLYNDSTNIIIRGKIMATIKDIAAQSGYSIATVSRVLNNQRNVDKKIQKKILKCAEDLNYKPNVLGQLLRTQNSKLIMCVIPDVIQGMRYEVFYSMRSKLLSKGYQLLLYPCDSSMDYQQNLIPMLENGLIGGVIFVSPVLDNEKLSRLNQNYPLVQYSEYNEDVKTAIVTIDYAEAMKDGMKYLLDCGHSRIAALVSAYSIPSLEKKMQGYQSALADANIPFDSNLIIKADLPFSDSTVKAIASMMKRKDRPTAIMCVSDNIAFQCINTLQNLGFRVPEDCSVMGFDNAEMSETFLPALTTIGAPLRLMGTRTVDLLLNQIKTGEKTNEKIFIPHEIFIRKSVASSFLYP